MSEHRNNQRLQITLTDKAAKYLEKEHIGTGLSKSTIIAACINDFDGNKDFNISFFENVTNSRRQILKPTKLQTTLTPPAFEKLKHLTPYCNLTYSEGISIALMAAAKKRNEMIRAVTRLKKLEHDNPSKFLEIMWILDENYGI